MVWIGLGWASGCAVPSSVGPVLPAQVLAEPTRYEQVESAVVEILVDGRLTGTGWIADANGSVITAAHVVWPGTGRIEVRSERVGRLRARAIAADRGHDLALLQLPESVAGYPHLPLRGSTLEPGETVWVHGSPIFRHGVMLRGDVARGAPTYEYLPDRQHYVGVWHISGSSPKGMSGGPWVDDAGEAVGVQSGYMSSRSAPVGIAFAAPIEPARRLLRGRTTVQTPTLGVAMEELWEQPVVVIAQWARGMEGVLPVVVHPDGPASDTRLSRRTLITAIEGRPVSTRDELLDAVRARRAGDRVRLTLVRAGGGVLDQVVTLGSLESEWGGER